MISVRTASTARILPTLLLPTLLLATLLLASGAALADCNSDLAGLGQKRQTFMDKLNAQAKAAKGKLDPVASCPTLRGLVSAEAELIKYLDTNKTWCNVPDNVVDSLKANDAKSKVFEAQACKLAAQAKQQQQQAASGGGGALGVEAQKLPAGPL